MNSTCFICDCSLFIDEENTSTSITITCGFVFHCECLEWFDRQRNNELEKKNKELIDRVKRLQNSEDNSSSQLKKVTDELKNQQNTFRMKCKQFRTVEMELKRQVNCLQSAESRLTNKLAEKIRELQEINQQNAWTMSMNERYKKLIIHLKHKVNQWKDVANSRSQLRTRNTEVQNVKNVYIEANVVDEDFRSYDELEEINKELTDRVERLQNSEDSLSSQLKKVTHELENYKNIFRIKCEEWAVELELKRQVEYLQSAESRLTNELAEKNKELQEMKEKYSKATSIKEGCYQQLITELRREVDHLKEASNWRNSLQKKNTELQLVRKDHVEANLVDEDLKQENDALKREISRLKTDLENVKEKCAIVKSELRIMDIIDLESDSDSCDDFEDQNGSN